MSEIKLKPCPFCYGMAKLNSDSKIYNEQLYLATWVECEVCHAKSKEVWNTQYDNRPNDREKEVIEKWNTRKPIERIVERLKEISYDEYYSDLEIVRLSEAIAIVKEEGE